MSSPSDIPTGSFPRLPRRTGFSLLKLRLAMIGTLGIITATASLVMMALLTYVFPAGASLGIYGILGFVAFFHIIQWLVGPYMINAAYHVKPLDRTDHPWLHEALQQISISSGLRHTPKLMIAEIEIPNAFAYGNPLTGNMVAITRGLLNNLPKSEVEAVLAHEVGHIKHRDVVFMMVISIVPAVLWWIGYTLLWSGRFGYYGYSSNRGGGAGYMVLIGMALIALSFVFNIFVFAFSRFREYYADTHAAMVTRDGARNLQRALVRIMNYTGRLAKRNRAEYARKFDEFKMFFISDPDSSLEGYGNIDALVERVKRQKASILSELFSTHPHPAKRLRHLDSLVSYGYTY